MKRKKIIILAFIVSCSLIRNDAVCQQAINVSSHSANINGLKFDYSIGEMALVSTERNSNLIVPQGLLQPNSTGVGVQMDPATTPMGLSEMIKVYPNPTENILFVESIENADAVISYQLFDATGKIVINNRIAWKAGPNKFSLDLKNYAAGAYYLMLTKPNARGAMENYSYKIQKTN